MNITFKTGLLVMTTFLCFHVLLYNIFFSCKRSVQETYFSRSEVLHLRVHTIVSLHLTYYTIAVISRDRLFLISRYITEIKSEADFNEYMKTLLDFSNQQHKSFFIELLRKKFPSKGNLQLFAYKIKYYQLPSLVLFIAQYFRIVL